MRETYHCNIHDPDLFLKKFYTWLMHVNNYCCLDSNGYYQEVSKIGSYHSFEFIAGVDVVHTFSFNRGNPFNELDKFHKKHGDWLFGHLSYDLKNYTENLVSDHLDNINFPDIHFFIPKYIFELSGKVLYVRYLPDISSKKEVTGLVSDISRLEVFIPNKPEKIKINQRVSRNEYTFSINKILEHIKRGDIYEMNYCMEFFAKNVRIDPVVLFERARAISPAPFSAFYRCMDKFLISSSPERYVRKNNNHIISQPIKGTVKKGRTYEEDEELKKYLKRNPKEMSENIMIVDLVRNDLSRIAEKGTVKVDELAGIYTFSHVHQMISTVSALLHPDLSFSDAIQHTFPMGSMTGAPKIRAMELIEKYEKTKRGLYSGSVGYITDKGDFDFNVVIRSILYNDRKKYLNFMVGSAITSGSDPGKEYSECILKAEGMFSILQSIIQ